MMIRNRSGLVILFCMSLAVAANGADAATASYKMVARKDVMVPMRDGVKLATDIYLPSRDGTNAAAGRFPCVFARTPYGKGHMATVRLVASGYVVVTQDTRGRGGSEGVWHWMTDDRDDGCDAVEWLAAQPWSNGRIGMHGNSYVGATQHLAAMARAPHLTTIIPSNPSINHGGGSTIYGGTFRLRVWNWLFSKSPDCAAAKRDPVVREALERMVANRSVYLANLPLRAGTTPLSLAPEYEEPLIEMMAHRRNDAFWRFSNIRDYVAEHKDIPVLMFGGWYDLFSSSTTETYAALRKNNKSAAFLLVGPWGHAPGRSHYGQAEFGPEAAVALDTVEKCWFDRWLKGDETAFSGTDSLVSFDKPVRLFVMGTGDGHKTKDGLLYHGGYWRSEADYPLPQAVPTAYHFQAGGELAPAAPGVKAASTSFTFDPSHPVPTLGGCTLAPLTSEGPYDQRGGPRFSLWQKPVPLSVRNDILVFRTPPLERDTEIIGPVAARVWASSSAVDTDFTAKLIDVYPPSADFPDGFDLIIGDGIIRARYRNPSDGEDLLTPGKIYPFDIKLDPCCNVFKKGHRIRVDISSSNYPRFDVNPNTGEPPNDNRRMVTAVNTIYHDAKHPSHIVLPVMPVASKEIVR